MPDATVRAGGAVVARGSAERVEVALVHRPKYDDWTLPKGKVERGEHLLAAAVREATEETGDVVRLGRPLGWTRYLVKGSPKRVDYWAARPTGAKAPVRAPASEVDEVAWLDVPSAMGKLSYDRDRRILRRFAERTADTSPLVLLRHASAGPKSGWPGDDLLRPLDDEGVAQAAELASLLSCFGITRVISSVAERCAATVRPYAAAARVELEVEPVFTLGHEDASNPPRGFALMPTGHHRAAECVGSIAADPRPAVICAHRENLPLLLAAACQRLGATQPLGPPLRMAEFWVLHRADGKLAATERHLP